MNSLSFDNDGEEVPNIIALSDQGAQQTAVQPRLGRAMSSFLSYLLFWQDTIDHCRSAEVCATLLDHFQVLFLEQLLYVDTDVYGGVPADIAPDILHSSSRPMWKEAPLLQS